VRLHDPRKFFRRWGRLPEPHFRPSVQPANQVEPKKQREQRENQQQDAGGNARDQP